jgi:hypothetical protein
MNLYVIKLTSYHFIVDKEMISEFITLRNGVYILADSIEGAQEKFAKRKDLYAVLESFDNYHLDTKVIDSDITLLQ